jgi:protein-tyrosine phosphatase
LLDATVNPHLTHSKLKLTDSQDGSMIVHHFLFHAWPDHGVPETEEDVNALKNLLETSSKLQQTEQCEVYVNCSAGIGRTGTFIALWSLLASPMRFTKPIGKVEPASGIKPFPAWAADDKVAKTIDMLREQRGMMCQTTGQIDFIYRLTGTTPAQP